MKGLFTRRYVGDYRLENVEDARGRIRTVPVYRGKRYRFARPQAEVRRDAIACAVAVGIAVAAEAVLLTVNSQLMRTWYASVPAILGLIPLIMLSSVVYRLLRIGNMIRREDMDRFENRFPASAAAFGILNVIAFAGGIVVSFKTPAELALCLCPLICAAAGGYAFSKRKTFVCSEDAPQE